MLGSLRETARLQATQRRGNAAATSMKDRSSNTESSPFTKEQLEALQKILAQANLSQNSLIGTGSLVQKGNILNAFAIPKEKTGSLIVDSSGSDHMTEDASILQNFIPYFMS